MSLQDVLDAIIAAAQAALHSVEAAGADVGIVEGSPQANMAGLYTSWEAFSGYFNVGAGVHHNQLVQLTSALRRIG